MDFCEGSTVHLIDRWGHPYTGKVRYELSSRGYGTNIFVGPYLVRTYSGRPGAQVREIVSVEGTHACGCRPHPHQ